MLINEKILDEIKSGANIFYLIKVECNSGCFYFTTNDSDVYIDNILYKSNYIQNELLNENIETTNGFEIKLLNNNNELIIEQLINSNIEIKISTNNYSSIVFSGFIDKINEDNILLNIFIVPKIEILNCSFGQLFSPICRECIGSKKCGININNYKTTGEIIEIVSYDCIIGNHQNNKSTPIGYYKYGLIKFTTGKLFGITLQIKDEIEGKIFLLKNTKLLSIGDKYEIIAGCDKTLKTCKDKFNNTINFRGEPYINNITIF